MIDGHSGPCTIETARILEAWGGAMSATTDGKVVDPESVRWIEEGTTRQDDEEYFAGAWQRALKDARADVAAAGPVGTLSKLPEIS
jgi:hypothetical protein